MSMAKSIKSIGVTILFIVALLMMNSDAAADECKVINIISGSGFIQTNIVLQPDILSVSKGRCVGWINRARIGNVKIRFQGEKDCDKFMAALSGFKMDPDSGCFVIDRLAPGGTASLRFNIEGMYNYIVEYDTAPTKYVSGKVGVTK